MGSYDDYKRGRDLAWEMLIKCGISSLPVALDKTPQGGIPLLEGAFFHTGCTSLTSSAPCMRFISSDSTKAWNRVRSWPAAAVV